MAWLGLVQYSVYSFVLKVILWQQTFTDVKSYVYDHGQASKKWQIPVLEITVSHCTLFNQIWELPNVGHFAYRMIRLHLSWFAYTFWDVSPTLKSIRLQPNTVQK